MNENIDFSSADYFEVMQMGHEPDPTNFTDKYKGSPAGHNVAGMYKTV